MASGVFGTPITEATVIASGQYPLPITQSNIADYAEKMISAGEKDINAQRYVDNLKDIYGNGISAKCLLYNATGTTLTFVDFRDFYGRVFQNPYPQTIMNGQWGAFLHVRGSIFVGSAGAVVYRSLRPNDNQKSCDWSFSWSMPVAGGSNRVLNYIRDPGHFTGNSFWNGYYRTLENSQRQYTDRNFGYESSLQIGATTTAVCRGVFRMVQ